MSRGLAITMLSAQAVFACRGASQDRVLRDGTPAQASLEAEGLERAAALLAEAVASGRVPSASVVVARHGIVALHRGWGRRHSSPDSPPVDENTVYIVASVTKPVTATAVMRLVERGLISLSAPASSYLPEFQADDRRDIRVHDLLTHVSGLPDMLPENLELRRQHAPLEEFVKRSMTTPLLFRPRTSFSYQSMGILLAAEIAERVSKQPLRDFMKEELFDPLGMSRTSLGLGGRALTETAWSGRPPANGGRPDPSGFGANTLYWRNIGHPWGGLHASARDLAVFLQMFLNGGVYGGRRILAPATVTAMTSDQNRTIQQPPWGLGWALRRSPPPVMAFFGDTASERAFGHIGASGTLAFADPERDLLCVVLTARPLDEDDGALLRRVATAVQASALSP